MARIATATQQPLEVLAAQSIASNLPPTPDNAPVEIQAELLLFQTWDDKELLAIAQSQITLEQQQRHVELLGIMRSPIFKSCKKPTLKEISRQ